MKSQLRKLLGMGLIAFLGISTRFSNSHAQEAFGPGIYVLIEVNGESLPVVTGERSSDGELCETETLEGAVLIDSEGRSAAFVTERETCIGKDGSETVASVRSVIFPGTYEISGNEISIRDEFGTDNAVLEGDLMIYSVENEAAEYILRKQ